MAVAIDDVRALTAGLPRSYEVFVHGRVKFRVGHIVYLAFSRDETLMGFAFPREEREAALETYPDNSAERDEGGYVSGAPCWSWRSYSSWS